MTLSVFPVQLEERRRLFIHGFKFCSRRCDAAGRLSEGVSYLFLTA
jgi:hypothetical protein